MPAEQLDLLFELLEGGNSVTSAEIIQFPVDAAGSTAEGALIGEGVSNTVKLGNGIATEVSQLTVVEGGATVTSSVGLLALDVGTVGAAIAPALGIIAGIGLYNLSPEFWTNVSNSLIEAGQTIGGKVRAFINGESKQIGLSQDTIEIFKNAFIDEGIFDIKTTIIPLVPTQGNTAKFTPSIGIYDAIKIIYPYWRLGDNDPFDRFGATLQGLLDCIENWCTNTMWFVNTGRTINDYSAIIHVEQVSIYITFLYKDAYFTITEYGSGNIDNYFGVYAGDFNKPNYFYLTFDTRGTNVWRVYESGRQYDFPNKEYNPSYDKEGNSNDFGVPTTQINPTSGSKYASVYYRTFDLNVNEGPIQPDAVLPDSNSFTQTYPNWNPWSETVSSPLPSSLPEIYPIEIPVNNPEPNQSEAQNPINNPEPSPFLNWLLEALPVPDPIIDPIPEPVPTPDPDPQPEPEPLPDIVEIEIEPNPIDPNKNPEPSPIPIIPIMPQTVESNAMFTVYNPSISQLNSFGGWLWNSNIIEQILRMWQNPLDGIISLMKVYATPSIGDTRIIQVGYINSTASAPVVSNQFVTIECGVINVQELRHNATDYTPYVSLHLYLPFIGIVELDPNEFMNGSISIKYNIDVYTGTCLAEVKAIRTLDMPDATIIYTFSGNASQQLPLTSSNFAGTLSSLVSVIGGGLSIATGGGLGAIAGIASIGHSLTHEMIHIGHSGALSANAGIMGTRIPYLIIGRRQGYDANNYNELYGYPVNKTVYLGNCAGYTRVKSVRLRTKATQEEKQEIESLLKNGVIF